MWRRGIDSVLRLNWAEKLAEKNKKSMPPNRQGRAKARSAY